ncbi:hypothetical protein SLS62_009603 [Diatrype stigma]|uniref:Uncharacterized protein n=1 Tax=Diatrype stigma TaxID=117547 RepID=A0AAN9UFE0_9PEZI
MCFAEYLGYTCGHTSMSVLRTCPQTTEAPTNPVCNHPATRPQLGQTFCVACAHIQHKRWNNIAEQEHRWMHERGACGCPVKFPNLMQPRMIVGGGRRGSYGIMSPDGNTCTVYGGGYGSKKGGKRSGGKNWRRGGGGGGYNHHNYAQQASRAQQQKDDYPPLQEIREGDDFRYAVRLPSTYGVEWAWDHEKLHRDGKCFCNVRFDKYVPQYDFLSNTQGSSVQQPAQDTGAADGAQAHGAPSNNDFLATQPFGEQSSGQSGTQSSGAQSSSLQPWAPPFAQSSGQGYGQTSTAQSDVPQASAAASQDFATQQGYPQYPTTQNAPQSHEYGSGSSNTAQTYGPNYTQDNRDPFSPNSMDDFSQTVPDSLTQLFPADNSNNDEPVAPPLAPPPPPVPPYTMPRVPLDVNNMPTWNPAQPQRWTCNPPAGYYNAQEVYLPPALPGPSAAATNTATTTSSVTRPPIAHGTNLAATSSGGGNQNSSRNNAKGKGKAKASNRDNNNNTDNDNTNTATANTTATTHIEDSSTGTDLGFGNPPRPVDMQTMWFAPGQAHGAQPPLVGLPIGLGPEGPDGAVQRPGQTYQGPVHAGGGTAEGKKELPPLNGFPIGAGPEGDAHAGPFEECPLYGYYRGAGEYGRGLRRPESAFL